MVPRSHTGVEDNRHRGGVRRTHANTNQLNFNLSESSLETENDNNISQHHHRNHHKKQQKVAKANFHEPQSKRSDLVIFLV